MKIQHTWSNPLIQPSLALVNHESDLGDSQPQIACSFTTVNPPRRISCHYDRCPWCSSWWSYPGLVRLGRRTAPMLGVRKRRTSKQFHGVPTLKPPYPACMKHFSSFSSITPSPSLPSSVNPRISRSTYPPGQHTIINHQASMVLGASAKLPTAVWFEPCYELIPGRQPERATCLKCCIDVDHWNVALMLNFFHCLPLSLSLPVYI